MKPLSCKLKNMKAHTTLEVSLFLCQWLKLLIKRVTEAQAGNGNKAKTNVLFYRYSEVTHQKNNCFQLVIAVVRAVKFISNVPFNFFVLSMSRKILASAHFFWEFIQIYLFEIQSGFGVRTKWRPRKKKRSSPKIERCLCPKSLLSVLLL